MLATRRSPRVPVARPATIELPGGPAGPLRLAARTLDLSRGGVALLVPARLAVGDRLGIILERRRPGLRAERRWQGEVVHVHPGPGGQRVGVAFRRPEAGPLISLIPTRSAASGARIRIDPPWEDPDAGPEPVDHPLDEPESGDWLGPRTPALRLFWRSAGLGLFADQATKALAAAPALADAVRGLGLGLRPAAALGPAAGHPAEGWLMALTGMFLAGAVARWAGQNRHEWRPPEALGWGLILGGLVSNAADRLARGEARGLLGLSAGPALMTNLADLLVLLGGLMVLAGGRDPGRPAPRAEARDLRPG